MACITLFAQPLAMATTELPRVVHYENASPQWEADVEHNSLRMNWVVVTDSGNRSLRMVWTADEDR